VAELLLLFLASTFSLMRDGACSGSASWLKRVSSVSS